ncbi:MAG: tetratricopeptide repeat protein [Deltaproteobacteria bacterium]|nr:tetratricopeptide repeat protein [Deltaproteobacteria bacterium]
MNRYTLPSLVLSMAVCAVLVATPAVAKKPAKVEIRAVDEQGEAIEGVQLTITSPDDPNFRQQISSNGKGVIAFEMTNAAANYLYQFDKEGFERQITTMEIQAGKKVEVQVVLPSANSAGAKRRRASELYNQGVEAFNAGEKTKSAGLFQQSAEADDTLAEPRIGLAEVAFGLGDWDTAAGAAQQALAIDETSLAAQRVLFEASLALHDEEKLAGALERIRGTELAGGAAVLVYNDGVAALKAPEPDRAALRFQQAIRLDPALAVAHAALASAHYNRQDFETCLTTVDHLLTLEPQNPRGLRLRYMAAEALGKAELAGQALSALEAVDPKASGELLYSRADAAFKNGNLDSAKQLLTRILTVDPEHIEANYTLGLCHLNGGNNAEARKQLERVIQLAPDSQQARDAQEMLQFVQ